MPPRYLFPLGRRLTPARAVGDHGRCGETAMRNQRQAGRVSSVADAMRLAPLSARSGKRDPEQAAHTEAPFGYCYTLYIYTYI